MELLFSAIYYLTQHNAIDNECFIDDRQLLYNILDRMKCRSVLEV